MSPVGFPARSRGNPCHSKDSQTSPTFANNIYEACRTNTYGRAFSAPEPGVAWLAQGVAPCRLGKPHGLRRLVREGCGRAPAWRQPRSAFEPGCILKPSGEPVISFDELVSIIDRENALWVQAARRISPEILTEFLDLTDRHLYEYFKSLKPDAPARIAVSWAGDSSSPNWFDIAREYTEKWLHQQHIREAVGAPLQTERQWLFPVLDTFLRALPHHYRNVQASEGTSIAIQVSGELGGEWTLVKQGADWLLFAGHDPAAAARIVLDQDLAWRLFTKGINMEAAGRQVKMEGDPALAERVLDMISIMA